MRERERRKKRKEGEMKRGSRRRKVRCILQYFDELTVENLTPVNFRVGGENEYEHILKVRGSKLNIY